MKTVLFICSNVKENTDANGICIRNIIQEILKRGKNIIVISESEKENYIEDKDNVKLYGIKNRQRIGPYSKNVIIKWWRGIIALFRRIVVTPFYPNVSPIRSRRVERLAKDLIEKYQIDTVIGAYRPYESIYAAMKLKKTYGERLKVITYHLDLLSSPSNTNKWIRRYKLKRGNQYLQREVDIVDAILLPESARGILPDNDKLKFADFPLYITERKEFKSTFNFPENFINLTYIGSLDANNRNPICIVEFLKKIPIIEGKKVCLHIWGKISDEETKKIIENNEYVIYHGVVENIYVRDLLEKSDFLLNISNCITYNMLPSKIFQLFSIKKPIINIVQHIQDCSVQYFEKCGYALNVAAYTNQKEKAVGALCEYIKNYYNKAVNCDDKIFMKSTPKYIVNQIEGI